ncbi:MAG: NAD(P)/FAD-dependent oxidoreductase [Acidobacteriota bacterium]
MRSDNGNFDVIILGGGPAGLGAAMWCTELGMTSILVEKRRDFGGQLHWIHVPIKNYPGIDIVNGADLLERLMAQLQDRKFEIRKEAEIADVDLRKRKIALISGETFGSKAIVIATGVRRRKLGVENDDAFVGRGILQTGQINREDLFGKSLLIVGGGDAAFENAFNLSSFAEKTYLLHRTSDFSARPEFVERVLKDPRVAIIKNAEVTSLAGERRLERVQYVDRVSKVTAELQVDSLLVRIGVVPNSEPFRDIERDNTGYIRVDSTGQTSIGHVFAVGDIANPLSPTISTAIGTASTAAKAIFKVLPKLASN